MLDLEKYGKRADAIQTEEEKDDYYENLVESLNSKITYLQDENIEQEHEILRLNRELKYVKKMWKREREEKVDDTSPLDMTHNTEVLIKLVNMEKELEE